MAIINEQSEIVRDYMETMVPYRIEMKSYWDILVETKLKGKDENYINEVSNLIDVYIDNGKRAFIKRYL